MNSFSGTKRTKLGAYAITAVVFGFAFTGCPDPTYIATGSWVFQFSTLNGTYGLNLVPPNYAVAFDNGSGLLEGPTYWEAKFGKLRLEQHAQSGTYIYEGDLTNGTSASGTFRLQNTVQVLGTWSGYKL